MATGSKLEVLLSLRDQFSSELSKAGTSLDKFKSNASAGLGKVRDAAKLAALAIGGIAIGAAAAAVSFIKSAAQEEVGIKRLQTAIATLDKAHQGSAKEVEKLIRAREKLAFSDDELRDSLALLIPATGDYEEAVKRQGIAMDVARGTGLDLATTSRLLGKVNEETIDVFKRYGITLQEGMSQTEALEEVQRRFSGQAGAYAETAAGKWEIFTNQIDNIKEGIGAALLPLASALGDLLNTHVTPALEKAVGHFTTFVDLGKAAFSGDIATVVEKFNALPKPLQDIAIWLGENKTKIAEFLDAAKAEALDAIVDAFEGWKKILEDLQPLLDTFGDWARDNTTVVGGFAIVAAVALGVLLGWPAALLLIIFSAGLARERIDELRQSNEDLDTTLKGLEATTPALSRAIDYLVQFSMWNWQVVLFVISEALRGISEIAIPSVRARIDELKWAFDKARDAAYWFKDALYMVRDAAYAVRDAILSIPSPNFEVPGLPDLPNVPVPSLSIPGAGRVPGLAMGIDYVPGTMPAILHEGERVLTKRENEGYGQASVNVVVNVNVAGDATDATMEKARIGFREEMTQWARIAGLGGGFAYEGAFVNSTV